MALRLYGWYDGGTMIDPRTCAHQCGEPLPTDAKGKFVDVVTRILPVTRGTRSWFYRMHQACAAAKGTMDAAIWQAVNENGD